jgi:Uma2 family endonuclease
MLEKSIDNYEYWNGVAVAMAGAQPEHVQIETNIVGGLFQQLRGKDCLPLVSNQAVKLAASRGYVFPDVTVVCGKPEYIVKRGIGCLLNPPVVVEVLSSGTAALDETDKLLAYTGIRTIRECLAVSSDRCAVKLFFRRAPSGDSPDETLGVRPYALPTDSPTFESCGCTLTLAEIYAGVDLPSVDLQQADAVV